MEPKFKNLTVKQAAYWLSEAWGEPIDAKNMRLRGNWMFVRNRIGAEVVCVPVPRGNDLHCEPWTDIKYDASPFVIKDKATIQQMLDKLDADYGYNDKPYLPYCLLEQTDGTPDFIPIYKEDFSLIAEYLRTANERAILSVEDFYKNHGTGKWKFSRKYENAMSKHQDLGNELIKRGIFHHKWHKRTTWELCEMEDNQPINVKTANACWKGEAEKGETDV